MVSAVQLERRMAGAYILSIVVCKLGHWQEPCLVILLEVDKGLKIGLYCAILMFRQTISLGVQRRGEPSLDAKKIAEQRPECRGE